MKIDTKQLTLAQIKEIKRKETIKKFQERYKQGRFTVIIEPSGSRQIGNEHKPPTSRGRYKATACVQQSSKGKSTYGTYITKTIECRNQKFFDNIEDCIKYARKKEFSEETIEMFTKQYKENYNQQL